MSKLTYQGILAILKLVFKLLARVISLIEVARDLLDDGLINQSVSLDRHDHLLEFFNKLEDVFNSCNVTLTLAESDLNHDLEES